MLPRKCLTLLLLLSPAIASAATNTGPATRPTAAILSDWSDVSQSLRVLLPPPRKLTSPDARRQIAPSVVPLLRKALLLSRELSAAGPDHRTAALQRYYHLLAVAAFLGDHPAIIELDNARRSANPAAAIFARHAWYLTRWWPRLNRPADAGILLDELQLRAASSPMDEDLASLLLQMREDLPPASSLRTEIETIFITHLRSPLAQTAIGQFAFAEKRRSLLGKPLLLQAPTIAGKQFSTHTLTGKTIILHFGQTNSPLWEEQHNLLLQYAEDLPANVAIVTILCDPSDAPVRRYLADRKNIPWPVLREADDPAGFAAQFGVDQFPQTIVIGPAGAVTAVDVTPDRALLEQIAP